MRYVNDKMLVGEIERFEMRITPSKALLSPLHRKALNPLRLHIVGAKQLPTVFESKYLPVYVKVKFFNGEIIKTQSVPHSSTCKWKYKHVFLAGKMDPVLLKEQLAESVLKFELHDKDEIKIDNLKEVV